MGRLPRRLLVRTRQHRPLPDAHRSPHLHRLCSLPNFHEKFITQSAQPFAQYEYHVTQRLTVTAGFKVSNYNVHLNQFADNGKTIGCLGGRDAAFARRSDFVTHTANYIAGSPPAMRATACKNNWSVYAQYATGNVIPPSSVFDVKNAAVAITPKPTQTKTFQFGSVLKTNRFTLDADAYFIHAQNAYASAPDRHRRTRLLLDGAIRITKGFEAEGNVGRRPGLLPLLATARSAQRKVRRHQSVGGQFAARHRDRRA